VQSVQIFRQEFVLESPIAVKAPWNSVAGIHQMPDINQFISRLAEPYQPLKNLPWKVRWQQRPQDCGS
jgi:hypothetical protein